MSELESEPPGQLDLARPRALRALHGRDLPECRNPYDEIARRIVVGMVECIRYLHSYLSPNSLRDGKPLDQRQRHDLRARPIDITRCCITEPADGGGNSINRLASVRARIGKSGRVNPLVDR